jgi:cell wall-associated NlpC family hydrolase
MTYQLPRRFYTALLCSSLLSAFLVVSAHADTYHAVEQGETIGSIAKRYSVSPDAIREANKLNLGNNSQLASMLLRIPGVDEKPVQLPTRSANAGAAKSSAAASAARYFGTLTKYSAYTVREGDTLEAIAAKFSGNGQEVSADEIRSKNKLTSTLIAGSVIQIPITTTYGSPTRTASAQVSTAAAPRTAATRPTARAISADAGDSVDMSVSVSEEVDLPFARAIPSSGAPVYQSPNAARRTPQPQVESSQSTPEAKAAPRGNVLASRGGFIPSPNLNNRNVDGARILQTGEELVTTPTPRVTRTPQPESNNMARVAKVALSGARIRRLPEAEAATLYRCSTGTEIAVLKQKGAWSAILMSDRSTGWLPTRYLRFTGTSVDISSQVITDEDRSDDTAGNWKSGYETNHPAVRHALQWLGTPYRYGGESRRGIDCSSLVQKSFASCGVRLPRVSRDQARVGKLIAPENLQPGDRLYFSASGTHVDHTGIYMGNGLFVHASGSAHRVTVSRLAERRNWNIFVCARR